MALDYKKRKKGESKREYQARMTGGKLDYNSDKISYNKPQATAVSKPKLAAKVASNINNAPKNQYGLTKKQMEDVQSALDTYQRMAPFIQASQELQAKEKETPITIGGIKTTKEELSRNINNNQDQIAGYNETLKNTLKNTQDPTIANPTVAQAGEIFRPLQDKIKNAIDTAKYGVTHPIEVAKEIPNTMKNISGITRDVTSYVLPGMGELATTTSELVGEAGAYAFDKNVREQYQKGNTDILPTLSRTTQGDIVKKTVAAGIDASLTKFVPETAKLGIIQRFGYGGLQGAGFAVSQGLAQGKSLEEITKDAQSYGGWGAAIEILVPYLKPLFKGNSAMLKDVAARDWDQMSKFRPGMTIEMTDNAGRPLTEKIKKNIGKEPEPHKIPEDLMMSEKGAQIYQELDTAQPGKRMTIREPQAVGPAEITGNLGQKSSFPQWVPSELRSTKLFTEVKESMLKNEVPKSKPGRRLYNLISDELYNRTGTAKPEIKPAKIESATNPRKADQFWEDTYAEKYGENESKINNLNQQLKTAPVAERSGLTATRDSLVKENAGMEDEFLNKYGSKPAEVKTQNIENVNKSLEYRRQANLEKEAKNIQIPRPQSTVTQTTKIAPELESVMGGVKEKPPVSPVKTAEAVTPPPFKASKTVPPVEQKGPWYDKAQPVRKNIEAWKKNEMVGRAKAESEAKGFVIPEKPENIYVHEAGGKYEGRPKVEQKFEQLRKLAEDELDTSITPRENYIPHVYKETPKEIRQAVFRKLRASGVDEQLAKDYLAGEAELPDEIAKRLDMSPSFSQHRTFPTYQDAEKWGLHPKYTNMNQLVGHYVDQIYKVKAANSLIDDLIAGKQVTLNPKAGQVPITLPGPKGITLYAPPKYAGYLNNYFRNEGMLDIGQKFFKYGATFSKKLQDLVLSGGLPKTNLNFLTFGNVVKFLQTGIGNVATLDLRGARTQFKNVFSVVRSNFTGWSTKWFDKKLNQTVIGGKNIGQRMAEESIDMSRIVGNFREDNRGFVNFFKNTHFKQVIGEGFDRLIQEKTFNSFLPMTTVNIFEDIFRGALKKGMSEAAAQKLAGDTTKVFQGLINSTKTRGTEDVLATVFFAPKYRENLMHVYGNALWSLSPTTWSNPAFKQSRRLLIGSVITFFGVYDMLNKKLTGHHMWENPTGKKLELMIPAGDGKYVTTPFMPSQLAFFRNIVEAAYAAKQGNIETVITKAGSNLSMGLNLVSHVLGNEDYFGNAIYDKQAPVKEQIRDIAGYVGLNANHPWVKGLWNLYVNQKASEQPIYPKYAEITKLREQGRFIESNEIIDALSDEEKNQYFEMRKQQIKPLAQILSEMTETPLRFTNEGKLDTQRYFESLDDVARKIKATTDKTEQKEILQDFINRNPEDSRWGILERLKKDSNIDVSGVKISQRVIDFTPKIDQIKNLIKEGKTQDVYDFIDKLSPEEQEVFGDIKTSNPEFKGISPYNKYDDPEKQRAENSRTYSERLKVDPGIADKFLKSLPKEEQDRIIKNQEIKQKSDNTQQFKDLLKSANPKDAIDFYNSLPAEERTRIIKIIDNKGQEEYWKLYQDASSKKTTQRNPLMEMIAPTANAEEPQKPWTPEEQKFGSKIANEISTPISKKNSQFGPEGFGTPTQVSNIDNSKNQVGDFKSMVASMEQNGKLEGDWMQFEPSTLKDLQTRYGLDESITKQEMMSDPAIYDKVVDVYKQKLAKENKLTNDYDQALWLWRPNYLKTYGSIDNIPPDLKTSNIKSADGTIKTDKEVMMQRKKTLDDSLNNQTIKVPAVNIKSTEDQWDYGSPGAPQTPGLSQEIQQGLKSKRIDNAFRGYWYGRYADSMPEKTYESNIDRQMTKSIINNYPITPEFQKLLDTQQVINTTGYGGKNMVQAFQQSSSKEDDINKQSTNKFPDYVQLNSPDPNSAIHESLHTYFDKNPKNVQNFNQAWDQSKKDNPAMQQVDKNLESYKKNYGKEFTPDFQATERFAWLGASLADRGLNAFPDKLQGYYTNVIKPTLDSGQLATYNSLIDQMDQITTDYDNEKISEAEAIKKTQLIQKQLQQINPYYRI